jgi:hypothetical protein
MLRVRIDCGALEDLRRESARSRDRVREVVDLYPEHDTVAAATDRAAPLARRRPSLSVVLLEKDDHPAVRTFPD